MTFYMAYRIAETYYNAGKYELGAKYGSCPDSLDSAADGDDDQRFFERIAKTYRRERWGAMLQPILSMWCECARQSGDVEGTVPLLLEMMGMRKYTALLVRFAMLTETLRTKHHSLQMRGAHSKKK